MTLLRGGTRDNFNCPTAARSRRDVGWNGLLHFGQSSSSNAWRVL